LNENLVDPTLETNYYRKKTTGNPASVAEKGNRNANGGKPRHNFKMSNITNDSGKEAKFQGRKEN